MRDENNAYLTLRLPQVVKQALRKVANDEMSSVGTVLRQAAVAFLRTKGALR